MTLRWAYEGLAFLGLIVITVTGCVIRWVNQDEEREFSLYSFLIYALTFLFSILISVFLRPVLYTRYISIVCPMLMLSLAYAIAAFKNKFVLIGLCLFIIGISLPQHVYSHTEIENGDMAAIQEFLDETLQPGDTFLHSSKFGFGMLCFY